VLNGQEVPTLPTLGDIGSTVGDTISTVGDTVSTVGDTVNSTVNNAGDTLSTVGDTVNSVVNNAGDTIGGDTTTIGGNTTETTGSGGGGGGGIAIGGFSGAYGGDDTRLAERCIWILKHPKQYKKRLVHACWQVARRIPRVAEAVGLHKRTAGTLD
jgi:hypothetical protein